MQGAGFRVQGFGFMISGLGVGAGGWGSRSGGYRGTSLMRNCPLPNDRRKALGIVLLWGPRRALFLMSEVPLHCNRYNPRFKNNSCT